MHFFLKFLFFLFFSVIFSLPEMFGQVYSYSNNFMEIGVGVREMAMGNSGTALSGGAGSGYWNSAMENKDSLLFSGELSHANYFNGLASFDSFSFSYGLAKNKRVSFSAIRFGVSDIPNTLNLLDTVSGNFDFNNFSSFSSSDNAFIFSYGQPTGVKNLRIGASVHLIYRKQGDFSTGYGLGFSASGFYSLKKWNFGVSIRHLTSSFSVWFNNLDALSEIYGSTNNSFAKSQIEYTAPQIYLGVSREILLHSDWLINTSIDLPAKFDGEQNMLVHSSSFNLDVRLGAEVIYKNLLFLRVGISDIKKVETLTQNLIWTASPHLGIGLKYGEWGLNYAATHIGSPNLIPTSHIISVQYGN